VDLEITVPTEPVRLQDLLPVFQGLTDLIVEIATRTVEQDGLAISCAKGCGACCRQPVPVSASEARALRDLVEAMPEPQRSRLRLRFREAEARLADAGLREAFLHPTPAVVSEKQQLAMSYFRLGMACPFLEDESCSIHPHRPAACREYLVTSPACHCARPTPETIRMVSLPSKVSAVLRALDQQGQAGGSSWLALALALAWNDAHPGARPVQPGPAWIEQFFRLLAGAQPPKPSGND
jgi:Fe-S-cluster containining protein